MSQDPCNTCKGPEGPLSCSKNKCCYWNSQGTCFLHTLEASFVYDILFRVPAAREGLLDCALDECCGDIPAEYVNFAMTTEGIKDDDELRDLWLLRFQKYRDHSNVSKPIQYKGDS
jgi:hypothetical protein